MIYDLVMMLLIAGVILYFENISKCVIFIIILYIIYRFFIENKTKIYDNITDTIKPNKLSEYIENNQDIKDIYEYKKYDNKSFMKGLTYYKKMNKYIDKLDKNESLKTNKNIIENCEYYLDESKKYFLIICSSIDDLKESEILKNIISDYYRTKIELIESKRYDNGLIGEYDTL
jgi:hypothetical protein